MRICMSTIGACRKPWREALAATAAAGFDAVEILAIDGWIHLDPRRDGAAQVAAELARHGLRPIGLRGGGVDGTDNAALGTSLAYVRRVVALAADLGCDLVNVNAGPVPDGTGPAEREAMRARAIRGI